MDFSEICDIISISLPYCAGLWTHK